MSRLGEIPFKGALSGGQPNWDDLDLESTSTDLWLFDSFNIPAELHVGTGKEK